jgi:hypothetical protein
MHLSLRRHPLAVTKVGMAVDTRQDKQMSQNGNAGDDAAGPAGTTKRSGFAERASKKTAALDRGSFDIHTDVLELPIRHLPTPCRCLQVVMLGGVGSCRQSRCSETLLVVVGHPGGRHV